MRREVFLSGVLFFLLFTNVFSESGLKQYQTFSWSPVVNARKYQVDVEHHDINGNWKKAASGQTRLCRMEMLLFPGEYRVSISTYNVLGKKATTSDQITFVILDETQPYLYDNLKKSVMWNSPVLRICKAKGTVAGTETKTIDTKDTAFVNAEKGDPDNSFFIKGKNIFFPETRFFLVPAAKSTLGGKSFEAFMDKRKESELTILRRDRRNSGIVVLYNKDELYSGYYNLEVRNPGGLTASLSILVLADQAPVINAETFEYNSRYKVSTTTIQRGDTANLLIEGTGFGNDTQFTFTPSTEGLPYPFASQKPRKDVILTLDSHMCLDDSGNMQLSFSFDSAAVQTGYYKFVASNGAVGSDELLLLVQVTSAPDLSPEVQSVKTSYDNKSQMITFTVGGQRLTKDTSIVLISPYQQDNGTNIRIPLSVLEVKFGNRKMILDADASKLSTGNYALLVENTMTSVVVYLEINDKYRTAVCTLTDEESEELFLRPENTTQVVEIQHAGATYEAEDLKVKRYSAFLFPYFWMDLTSNMDKLQNNVAPGVDYSGELDLFSIFGWLSASVGGKYSLDTKLVSAMGTGRIAVPWYYFEPYAGAGYGITFNSNFSGIEELFVPLQIGFVFGQFLDFRYNCNLRNVNIHDRPMYFENTYSIGCRLILGKTQYVKNVGSFVMTIDEEGTVSGTDYDIKENTAKIVFVNGITEIRDFLDIPSVKTVVLPDSIKVLGENAFNGCRNIVNINIPFGIEAIKANALAGCTSLASISIPSSVTTIENGAFSGLTADQRIMLDWSSDDQVFRSLSGLDDCDAGVYFNDGVEYTKKTQK
jgi:hypothetical protein